MSLSRWNHERMSDALPTKEQFKHTENIFVFKSFLCGTKEERLRSKIDVLGFLRVGTAGGRGVGRERRGEKQRPLS